MHHIFPHPKAHHWPDVADETPGAHLHYIIPTGNDDRHHRTANLQLFRDFAGTVCKGNAELSLVWPLILLQTKHKVSSFLKNEAILSHYQTGPMRLKTTHWRGFHVTWWIVQTSTCVQVVGLTWAFFHAEGSVGVLGPGIVLQLEGGGVVDERLRALCHTSPAVIEVGARLRAGKNSVELEQREEPDRLSAATHCMKAFADGATQCSARLSGAKCCESDTAGEDFDSYLLIWLWFVWKEQHLFDGLGESQSAASDICPKLVGAAPWYDAFTMTNTQKKQTSASGREINKSESMVFESQVAN